MLLILFFSFLFLQLTFFLLKVENYNTDKKIEES